MRVPERWIRRNNFYKNIYKQLLPVFLMRKEGILLILLISIIFILPLVIADEEAQIEKAYTCLENKINASNCSSLTFEERVFSLLATGKCEQQVSVDNSSNNCWPKSSCKVKDTAQAILALRDNLNTTKAENWLLIQTAVPTGIDWFLEIESSSPVSCKITYSDSTYTVNIGADKKISSNAGPCLGLAQDNYWLKISPTCYNKDIKISCNSGFITTLLFKKTDSSTISSTIHVSEEVHSAASNGVTTEKVETFCFAQGGVCNYEGSLWAAGVLHSSGYDISKFMPYLITMKDANKIYLPESLLYFLTGEFRTELLLKQKAGLYWEESGDRYYDTAMALLPFYYKSSIEKDNSKEWLLDVQGSDGCWNSGNTRNTAFLLYSIWPKETPNPYSECSINTDCPQISCKESICTGGVCFYDYFDCTDNDGCCNPGCNSLTDDDCEAEVECTLDSDCEIYASESNKYCSDDKTKVYKEISEWGCDNHVCVEETTEELVGTCGTDEECLSGNCLNKGDIPDEYCETGDDCNWDEECSDSGECIPQTPDENLDCKYSGYFCMSRIDCEGAGSIFENYDCTGLFVCCDSEKSLSSCSGEGGEICSPDEDEYCLGGTSVEVYDTVYGEICCVGGTCEISSSDVCEIDSDCDSGSCVGGSCVSGTFSCSDNQGTCKASCSDTEKENLVYDCDYGKICCLEKGRTTKSGYWWIWILVGLIALSAIGIVFRDKLRTQWLKLKSKFEGKKGKNRFEMPTPLHHPPLHHGILPRRIFPPSSGPIQGAPHRRLPLKKKPEEKSKNELDDVLKKLKDMGK